MRHVIVAAIAILCLAACASAPNVRTLVVHSAPRVSEFRFDDTPPLSAASDFAPWAKVTAANAAEESTLDACLADRDACATTSLLHYRRLLELAADLDPIEQVRLVQEYFNSVEQTLQSDADGDDLWSSLYRVASTDAADCKGIALGKYFTLRRLGWQPDDLRIVMNWDDDAQDWHALLAVHEARRTYVLDSILGLQRPQDFKLSYMVYSISESGIWDHAPDFVPVP